MQKLVLFVNGLPRSGKDTAVMLMQRHLTLAAIDCGCFSSIDPCREMLTEAGFDLSAKTEADRLLMARVGDAIEAHSMARTRASIEAAVRFFQMADESLGVFFLHMREPAMITNMMQELGMRGMKCRSVLVNGPRGEAITSNGADAGVLLMDYDYTITNDGCEEALSAACADLLHRLIEDTK